MILRGVVDFNFGEETYEVIKEIRAPGLNSDNFISLTFVPQVNEFHDKDDFIAEQIEVRIKETQRDKIVVYAVAPDAASDIYSFKFILSYGT